MASPYDLSRGNKGFRALADSYRARLCLDAERILAYHRSVGSYGFRGPRVPKKDIVVPGDLEKKVE